MNREGVVDTIVCEVSEPLLAGEDSDLAKQMRHFLPKSGLCSASRHLPHSKMVKSLKLITSNS